MSIKVTLPVRQIDYFVQNALPWLRKCGDYKKGLELRIAQKDEMIHVSVGGSAFFIEGYIVPPTPLGAPLPYPLFLDLNYLADFTFKDDTMSITLPDTWDLNEGDRRIQFRSPNVSFKIPLRQGSRWEVHQQSHVDLSKKNGFIFPKEFLSEFYETFYLPNSYSDGGKHNTFMIISKESGHTVYANDSYWAYCHEVADKHFKTISGNMSTKMPFDFFLPYKYFRKTLEFNQMSVYRDDFQLYGEMLSTDPAVTKIVWVSPLPTQELMDIPDYTRKMRKNTEWSVRFDTAEFSKSIETASSFFTDSDFGSVSLKFSVVGNQYTMVGSLPNSEMSVTGTALEAAPQSIRANLSARGLRDCMLRLKKDVPINIEVYRDSLVVYQNVDDITLLYWLPVRER